MTLIREIGCHFFRRKDDLFGFGRHAIISCLCVTDNEPVLYPYFNDLRINILRSIQKNVKKSAGKPPFPGAFEFVILFKASASFEHLISPLCFISFKYFDLYVLGDNCLIS